MANQEAEHSELHAHAGEGEDQRGEENVGPDMILQSRNEGGQPEAEEKRHGDERNNYPIHGRVRDMVAGLVGTLEHFGNIQVNRGWLVALAQSGGDESERCGCRFT